MNTKPLVINLLGGPGNLKSATAAGIFSLLKLHYINCELVTEFPKDLTWEENWKVLAMQGLVFSEQNRRLARITHDVDVIVTDTSLLFSLLYNKDTLTTEFSEYIMSVYNSYNNLNVNLVRNKHIMYEEFGRKESKNESMQIDVNIKSILNKYKLDYIEFNTGINTINEIVALILNKFSKKIKYTLKEVQT